MRILLTANASYVPPRGGATRSNLLWLDHLAAAGHTCRIVCARLQDAASAGEQMRQEGISDLAHRGPIEVHAADTPLSRAALLREQIASFQPDWVLVSSEDVGHTLLRTALEAAPGRVIYVAHTPQFFPFGPASWNPDPEGTRLACACAGIVTIGHAMADYVREATGCTAEVIHPPIYGMPPYPNHANFDRGFITMINPCAVKGISLFLEIAAKFPAREFAVLPGWGTTAGDREAIARHSNITVLPNSRDIDEPLSRTRILLMPSLWYEGFGLIVMESMLRGLPVIASDSGGLKEAKQGTGYVIPVNGIERYQAVYDEHAMPLPVMPENTIEPWCAALEELLTDRAAYAAESVRSRRRATGFTAALNAGAMERYLAALRPGHGTPVAPRPASFEALSPEKRALLLQRLRKRTPDAR